MGLGVEDLVIFLNYADADADGGGVGGLLGNESKVFAGTGGVKAAVDAARLGALSISAMAS